MIAAVARLIVMPCSKRPGVLVGSMPTRPRLMLPSVSPKANGVPRTSAWT